MREVSSLVAEGDIIDTFSVSVNLNATNEHHQIVGYYDIAAISISYSLTTITNTACYPSLVTTSTEGKRIVTNFKIIATFKFNDFTCMYMKHLRIYVFSSFSDRTFITFANFMLAYRKLCYCLLIGSLSTLAIMFTSASTAQCSTTECAGP